MNFEAKDLPYSLFEKIGMSKKEVLNLPAEELTALLSGRTTSLRPITVKMDGIDFKTEAKLSLYQLPDRSPGLKVHPYRSKVQNEYNLSQDQLQELKEGEIIVAPRTSLNGEKEQYLYQLDREINEIRSIRIKDIDIPKYLLGSQLSVQQKEVLLQGKTITVESLKNGKPQSVRIDLLNQKGYALAKEQGLKINQSAQEDKSYAVKR